MDYLLEILHLPTSVKEVGDWWAWLLAWFLNPITWIICLLALIYYARRHRDDLRRLVRPKMSLDAAAQKLYGELRGTHLAKITEKSCKSQTEILDAMGNLIDTGIWRSNGFEISWQN